MLAQKLMGSVGGASDKLYVDDVFSTYLYTGNGSTKTINNGIDLAGKGGLVWIKNRTVGAAATDGHYLFDSAGPLSDTLSTETNAGINATPSAVTSLNSNGFNLDFNARVNRSTNNYSSWTFRKAPKFFDVVTYTGNGVAGRQIPHSLGVAPGMIVVKATSNANDWCIYHKNIGATGNLRFDTAAAEYALTRWNNTEPAVANFTVGSSDLVNQSGWTYVAYLFAHDASADGIIQCGSFTTDGSGNATVDLGWEPQWVMVKKTSTGDEGNAGFWWMQDSMRGYPVRPMVSPYLHANTAIAEYLGTGGLLTFPTATGFVFNQSYSGFLNSNFIYLAIRRPNKPPTTGTEVYNATTSNATIKQSVGFVPDMALINYRATPINNVTSRLIGKARALTHSTAAEVATAPIFWDEENGYFKQSYDTTNINHFFKRAPGFMDVVCYTGTGVARTVPHGLGVAPELMILKGRGNAYNWNVWHKDIGNQYYLELNHLNAKQGPFTTVPWNNTAPTSTVFTVGAYDPVNQSGIGIVAYLFATLPGISKVGSYAGNGGTQTIDCGFTTGARFILVKRTDATGDWYVWDSVRGIVSTNDPHLSLNKTAAEVTTDDSVDPTNEGFIVNNVSPTNINVNAASYIYLAIA